MEKKTRFFGALGGMFKGLVHPAEYIKTGKSATWFSKIGRASCRERV